MTVAAFLYLLAIYFCAGYPFALLLPRGEPGLRILLMPFLGLSAAVLICSFGAALGLTGRSVAILSLVVIAAIFVGALLAVRSRILLLEQWRPEPITDSEWRAAAPVLLAGLACTALIGWPLFWAGYANYWGFANPDQAFYMMIIDHLDDHALSQPPEIRTHGFGITGTSSILSLCYLPAMVSALLGIKSYLLFGVIGATAVFLLPLGAAACVIALTPALADVALAFGAITGLSSVLAQTFYLHSIGALAVAAILPPALAVAVLYVRDLHRGHAIAIALMAASSLFSYFPGFAIVAVIVGVAFAPSLLWGRLPVRKVLYLAAGIIGLIAVVFAKQAWTLIAALTREAGSSRLASTVDEVLLTFAKVLTEQFVTLLWGLEPFGTRVSYMLWLPLFAIGVVVTAVAVLAVLSKRSSLPLEFRLALGTALLLIAIYFAKNNGYGVYKLITWTSPLLRITFAAGIVMLWRWNRAGRAVALLTLLLYGGINTGQIIRLGKMSLGATAQSELHNAPFTQMGEVAALRDTQRLMDSRPFFVAAPDQVLQRWTAVFLPQPVAAYLPVLHLNTEDSDDPAATPLSAKAQTTYVANADRDPLLLHMTAEYPDIVRSSEAKPLWQNRLFSISSANDIRNSLLLGSGWYRRETVAIAGGPRPFRWLRKRAEIFVVHPVRTPQRLRITAMAGYGIQTPARRLRLLLNGKQIDELPMSGFARLQSAPFTIDNDFARIEVVVVEDAEPLMRQHGFWNLWVPHDPRRMNIGVFDIDLIPAEGQVDSSKVSVSSIAKDRRTLFDGIYPDKWMGQQAKIFLAAAQEPGEFHLRGLAPGATTMQFPLTIRISANGQAVGQTRIPNPGNFDFAVPLPAKEGSAQSPIEIAIEPSSKCFYGVGDTRCLTLNLEEAAIQPAPVTASKSRL